MVARTNYGKLVDVINPPNLIDIQTASYREFLQLDVPGTRRKHVGLQAVFKEVFPIESYDGRYVLDFVKYEFSVPKMDPYECLREGQTYAGPLHVTFRLKDGDNVREESVYMGEITLMTPQGSFIINGAERAIVSQLHRSPGICFEQSTHSSGTILYSFRIIPDRGSWVEVQFDSSDLLWIYLDRRHRRRKFLATTFLRALLPDRTDESSASVGNDEEILALFYPVEKLKLSSTVSEEKLVNRVFRDDVIDVDSQTVLARKYDPVTENLLAQMRAAGFKEVEFIDTSWDGGVLLKSVLR